jgi:hypothetical protein
MQGVTGPYGPQGPRGPDGPIGARGVDGQYGMQGIRGYPGASGFPIAVQILQSRTNPQISIGAGGAQVIRGFTTGFPALNGSGSTTIAGLSVGTSPNVVSFPPGVYYVEIVASCSENVAYSRLDLVNSSNAITGLLTCGVTAYLEGYLSVPSLTAYTIRHTVIPVSGATFPFNLNPSYSASSLIFQAPGPTYPEGGPPTASMLIMKLS